jgi:hypothetical protein
MCDPLSEFEFHTKFSAVECLRRSGLLERLAREIYIEALFGSTVSVNRVKVWRDYRIVSAWSDMLHASYTFMIDGDHTDRMVGYELSSRGAWDDSRGVWDD